MSNYEAVMYACQVMDRINKRSGRKCGAKTRQGTPCQMRPIPWSKRCRLHGGLSTGPKTPEGRERIAEAQRRRWAAWRNQNAPLMRNRGIVVLPVLDSFLAPASKAAELEAVMIEMAAKFGATVFCSRSSTVPTG